jgi:hypothetical protein
MESNRTDPLILAFPKIIACSTDIYGPGGSVMAASSFCVCPSNRINEFLHIAGLILIPILILLCIFDYLVLALAILMFPYKKKQFTPKLKKVSVDKKLFGILLSKNLDPLMWEEVLLQTPEVSSKPKIV